MLYLWFSIQNYQMRVKYICKGLIIIIGIFSMTATVSSCKVKEGCGLEEKYNNPDMESSKRGKSNLFSKAQQKKMKSKK